MSDGKSVNTTKSISGKQQQHPLTIPLLSRIFDFTVATPRDIAPLLRVSALFQESAVFFSAAMWERLGRARFGGARLHGRNWSYYSYTQRHLASRYSKMAGDDLAEIEGCVEPQFRFRCPLLSSQLQVLDEVRPGTDDRVLFCHVCEKKVYTVSDPKDIGKLAGQGRCVLITAGARQLLQKKKTQNNDGGNDDDSKSPKNAIDRNIAYTTTSLGSNYFLAVVTDEPAPTTPAGYYRDQATEVLHRLRAKCAEHCGDTIFLSRDSLRMQCVTPKLGNVHRIFIHVIRIRSAPADLSQKTLEEKYKDLHPTAPGQPLCESEWPTVSGWSVILPVTKTVVGWFEKANKPAKRTQFHSVKIRANSEVFAKNDPNNITSVLSDKMYRFLYDAVFDDELMGDVDVDPGEFEEEDE